MYSPRVRETEQRSEVWKGGEGMLSPRGVCQVCPGNSRVWGLRDSIDHSSTLPCPLPGPSPQSCTKGRSLWSTPQPVYSLDSGLPDAPTATSHQSCPHPTSLPSATAASSSFRLRTFKKTSGKYRAYCHRPPCPCHLFHEHRHFASFAFVFP